MLVVANWRTAAAVAAGSPARQLRVPFNASTNTKARLVSAATSARRVAKRPSGFSARAVPSPSK